MTVTRQVIPARSSESIWLALLAGYNADLSEALNALILADHMAASTVPWEQNLVGPLVTNAIIAYGRCFTTSNVREKLDTIITIPENHSGAHESLMKLRNSTVAHSESTLMPTLPVVNLERETRSFGAVRATSAMALTVSPQFGSEAIEEFHAAVTAVKQELFVEIEVAKGELLVSLSRLPSGLLESLWESGEQPQLVEIAYDEWDIRTRRRDYPTSNLVQVVVPAVQTRRTYLMGSAGRTREGEELREDDGVATEG